MEPLTSFAISIAAGIALDIYNKSQGTVKNELIKAFEKTLKSWCKNDTIREQKRNEIKLGLNIFIEEPELLADIQNQNLELYTFLKQYEETLAQFTAAYNYVKEIRDLERFRKEVTFLSSIKDTVEDTNKKLTDFIENNLPDSTILLEDEWKRQLLVYKDSISSFRPKTALNLLLKLEESFDSNNLKPSNHLLSSIEFLKAQCYELIGKPIEMHQSYIKANNLNSSTIQIKEKACFSYAKTGDKEKSNYLINEILKYDEFNSVAWAVKIINEEDVNLESLIINTPQMVRDDWNFKRLVYLNALNDNNYRQQISILEKYNLLTVNYTEEPLNLTNYKKALFAIELTLSRFLQCTLFEFTRIKPNKIESIRDTNKILCHFLEQMSESEILSNYSTIEFCYLFTEFVLNENRESVVKMKSIYKEIDKHNISFLMMLGNSLQLIGEIDDAIALINEQEEKSVETIHLEAFCYIKKSDIDNYILTVKELLSSIKHIDLSSCENILSIPLTLSLNNRLQEFEASEFIENKEFEYEYLQKLITSFIRILKKQEDEEDVETLKSIENEILKTNSSIKFYIPYSYFLLENWDLAIITFQKYISKEYESRDLFYYVLSLEKSLSKHNELLIILESWRTNFSFNEELLRIEADLCRQLPDWERCLSISDYYLSKHNSDESFLVLKIISLNEINTDDSYKKIEKLAEVFKEFDFKFYGHVPIVCRILIENKFYQIALDLIYKRAIDNGNLQARMDYFMVITQIPQGIIQEKEVVEFDYYVKFSIEKEIKFIKIQKGNSLAEKLIGHKTGDTVNIERPLVKTIDSIIILRIMDKYLCLHDEILEEVRANPYAGFPMQSLDFEDTSPEGLRKSFIEIFGAEGTILKEKQDDTFKKYYNFNLSLTELIIQIYYSNYLGGYFNLVSYKDGITQIPLIYYPNNISIENCEIVIDFSSLIILNQISREHNITYKSKFLISKGVVEYIRAFLKRERFEPREVLSLNITHNTISANKLPDGTSDSNVVYLEKLLDWIDSNCNETIVSSKLDLIRKLDDKVKNDELINLIIENVSLVMEKENRIILTDDLIYSKFYPIQSRKNISSELYLKYTLSDIDACQVEFVKNKYIGHTFHSNILLLEFNKKLKDQPNNYAHCITNTSLRLIPSKYTIFTIISFLKQIALNPLVSQELFKLESTNALMNLLKGQREEKPFRITELLLRKEFELLGAKLELVLESYRSALMILGII